MSSRVDRFLRPAAWSAWAVSVVAFVVETVLLYLNAPFGAQEVPPLVTAIEDLAFVGIATLSLLILRRQPGNPAGWAMMAVGLTFPLEGLFFEVASYSLRKWGEIGLTLFAAWVVRWIWVGSQLAIPFILLYYPDGKLPSPRWKWAVRYIWTMAAFAVLGGALGVEPMVELGGLHNPLGVELSGPLAGLSSTLDRVGFVSLPLLGALSLIPRYRRSRGVERQQMKIIAWVAGVSLFFFGVFPFISTGLVVESLGNTVFTVFVGVSLTAGIVRYRVFEIDRIISRTVSYALVVSIIGLGYFSVVTVGARLLPSQNALAVAGATLAAAAAFNPLRRRIQSVVDKRFNRSKYRAEAVTEGLSNRLDSALSVGEIGRLWEETVVAALEPAGTAVWLADRPAGETG